MFEERERKLNNGRRKVIAYITSIALALNFMPFFGNVEEAAAVTITGPVGSVEITARGTVGGSYTSTITIAENGTVGATDINIPSDETGLALSQTSTTPGTSVGGITVGNFSQWVQGSTSITADITWTLLDDATLPDGSSAVPVTITIVQETSTPEPDPGILKGVSLSTGTVGGTGWKEGAYCVKELVSNPRGTMTLTLETGYTVSMGEGTRGFSSIGGSSFEYNVATGEIAEQFILTNGTSSADLWVELYIPQPPTPGGGSTGGGGGGQQATETIDVTNQENSGNSSSDTILTPNGTTEGEGVSNTGVDPKEVDALINLVEQHKDDIPEGDREAIIRIEDKTEGGNGEYNVNISENDGKKISNSSIDSVTIQTSIGDFRLKTNEMANLIEKNKGNMKFQMIKISHEGRPGIDAKLEIGNVLITQMETGYGVEIRIPYEPQEGEDFSGLVIEYIDEEGNVVIVTESRYEPETGCLVFFTTHLSKYGVSYKPKTFTDVPLKHWAAANITFLASRGVIAGGGDGKFRPDDKVTKAEFITMMTKAFSAASLGKKAVKSYKDVKTDDWYSKAIGWSYMNNISNVIASNGMLYPNQNLSRQDMATLSNNISLSLKLSLKGKKAAINFKDVGQIKSYAKAGVDRMVKHGILAGNTSGNLMPNASLTRAEASKVIGTLISGLK